jgi:hypothetical protein
LPSCIDFQNQISFSGSSRRTVSAKVRISRFSRSGQNFSSGMDPEKRTSSVE